ncbi:MAG: hypothetical protein AAGG80_02825, partial [Pseudomonadota bacterium]
DGMGMGPYRIKCRLWREGDISSPVIKFLRAILTAKTQDGLSIWHFLVKNDANLTNFISRFSEMRQDLLSLVEENLTTSNLVGVAPKFLFPIKLITQLNNQFTLLLPEKESLMQIEVPPHSENPEEGSLQTLPASTEQTSQTLGRSGSDSEEDLMQIEVPPQPENHPEEGSLQTPPAPPEQTPQTRISGPGATNFFSSETASRPQSGDEGSRQKRKEPADSEGQLEAKKRKVDVGSPMGPEPSSSSNTPTLQ